MAAAPLPFLFVMLWACIWCRKLAVNFGSPYKLSRTSKAASGDSKRNGLSSPFSDEGVPTGPVDEDGLYVLSENAPTIEMLSTEEPAVRFPPAPLLGGSEPPPEKCYSPAVGPAAHKSHSLSSNFAIPTLKLKRRLPPLHRAPTFQGDLFQPVQLDGSDRTDWTMSEDSPAPHSRTTGDRAIVATNLIDISEKGDALNMKLRRVSSCDVTVGRALPSTDADEDETVSGQDNNSYWESGHVRGNVTQSDDRQIELRKGAEKGPDTSARAEDLAGLPWPDLTHRSPAASIAGSNHASDGALSVGGDDGAKNGGGPGGYSDGASPSPAGNGHGGAEESLPEGWVKRFSGSRQCNYWFNTMTGTSQWYPPIS